MEVYDNEGTPIGLGDEVAYNHSGAVNRGTVVGLKRRTKYGRPYVEVSIQWGRYKQYTSKVQNNEAILVIKSAQ